MIAASGSEYADTGTVIAASDAEIRSLDITSLGVGPDGQKNYATAVYVPQDVTTKMNDVTIEAFNGLISTRGIFTDGAPDGSGGYIGATAYLNEVSITSQFQGGISGEEQPQVVGIYSDDGSTVYANDSTITSHSGYDSYGLYALDSSVYLQDTQVETVSDFDKDDNQTCAGIYAKGLLATLTLRNTATQVDCHPPSSYNYTVLGIAAEDSGLIQLFDSSVSVTDGMMGKLTGISMMGNSTSLTLTNVKVDVYGQNAYNYGIFSSTTPFVIRDSSIYTHGSPSWGQGTIENKSRRIRYIGCCTWGNHQFHDQNGRC